MNFIERNFQTILLFFTAICLFTACDNPPQMPKPSTYLRLELLNPNYIAFNDSEYPFTFSYPDYAQIQKLDSPNKNIKFFNLFFEKYNYVANVTYLPLMADTTLWASVNDCYRFLKRHEKLSGGIVEQNYSNQEKKVYGTAFEIKGKDVVSPYQFYLTDSVNYFVRFSLNCNFVPNNDSCGVVIEQLKSDLNNIISTFEWR
ncbi:MAG: hypothetical protein IJ759_05345 [Bacteroidales bacterium]|nr:hypothetical protein [Bacteroidales bacterium]